MSWQKKNFKNDNQSSIGLPSIFFKNKSILNFKNIIKPSAIINHSKSSIYNLNNDKKSLYSEKLHYRINDNRLFNEQKLQTAKMLENQSLKINEKKDLIRNHKNISLNIFSPNIKRNNIEIINHNSEDFIDFKRQKKSSTPNKKVIRQLDREFTLRDETFLNNPFLFEYKPIINIINKPKVTMVTTAASNSCQVKRYKVNESINTPIKVITSSNDNVRPNNNNVILYKTKTIFELMSEIDSRRLTYPKTNHEDLSSNNKKINEENLSNNKINQRLLNDDIPEPSITKRNVDTVKIINNVLPEPKVTTIIPELKSTNFINNYHKQSSDNLNIFNLNKEDDQNKSNLSILSHNVNDDVSNIKTIPVISNDNSFKKVSFNEKVFSSYNQSLPLSTFDNNTNVSMIQNINDNVIKKNDLLTLSNSSLKLNDNTKTNEKPSILFNSSSKEADDKVLTTSSLEMFGMTTNSENQFKYYKNETKDNLPNVEETNPDKIKDVLNSNNSFSQPPSNMNTTSIFGRITNKIDNMVSFNPTEKLNDTSKTCNFGVKSSISPFSTIVKPSNLFNSKIETCSDSLISSSSSGGGEILVTSVIKDNFGSKKDDSDNINSKSIFSQSSFLPSTKFNIETPSTGIFKKDFNTSQTSDIFAFDQNINFNNKRNSITVENVPNITAVEVSSNLFSLTQKDLVYTDNIKPNDQTKSSLQSATITNNATFSSNIFLPKECVVNKTSVSSNEVFKSFLINDKSSTLKSSQNNITPNTSNNFSLKMNVENETNINNSFDYSLKKIDKLQNQGIIKDKTLNTESNFIFGSSTNVKTESLGTLFGKNVTPQSTNMFNFCTSKDDTCSSNVFISTVATSFISSYNIKNNEVSKENDILKTSHTIFGSSISTPKVSSQSDLVLYSSVLSIGVANPPLYSNVVCTDVFKHDLLKINTENITISSPKTNTSGGFKFGQQVNEIKSNMSTTFTFGQQTNDKTTSNLFNSNQSVESIGKPNIFKQSLGSTPNINQNSNIFEVTLQNKSKNIFGTNKNANISDFKESGTFPFETKTCTSSNLKDEEPKTSNTKFVFQSKDSDNKTIINDKSSLIRDRVILKRKP